MNFNWLIVILILCSATILYTKCIVSAGVGRGDRKVLLRQCDMPTFRNGITKLRQKGKFIKFQCYKSFTLIGSIYAGCIGGKWDTTIPICAKSGCQPITAPSNGYIMTERQGIMATFFCKEHYKPAGVQTTYCDGVNWIRPIGTCRSTKEISSRWCDFEIDDLCGWVHDDTDDFEWKRVVGVDNLRKFRTGPQHDHTTMISNAGHYMLVESVNQLPEDRARLISPVYSSNLSRNTCFRFYYHMYGATVGTLRVYIKPMSIDMDTLIQDQSYLYFEISGNQKNMWKEAVFHLSEINEDFQIVLDGSAGNNHLSDIAIDDVALLNEEECPQDDNEEMSTTNAEEDLLVYDIQSCANRCDEKTSVSFNTTSVTDSRNKTIIITCDCHPECEDLLSCCPDYRQHCTFATTYYEFEDEKYPTTLEIAMKEIQETTELNQLQTGTLDTKSITFLITRTNPEETTKTTKSNVLSKTSKLYYISTDDNENDISKTTFPYPEWNTNMASTESTDKYQSNSSNELNFQSHEWKLNELNSFSIPTWIIVILSTLLAALLIFIATFSIIYYRKHYGLESYKKNSENATRNAAEEFSEVRYFISAEQLDFTLQTPEAVDSPKL